MGKTENNEFKIGDRVIGTGQLDHRDFTNNQGTIVAIFDISKDPSSTNIVYGVKFDNPVLGGHDLNGLAKMGYGFVLPGHTLQLEDSQQPDKYLLCTFGLIPYWTPGKVYEIIDNHITNDKGIESVYNNFQDFTSKRDTSQFQLLTVEQRIAKAGEYVLVTNPAVLPGDDYRKGDILKIIKIFNSGLITQCYAEGKTDAVERLIFSQEYLVLTNYSPTGFGKVFELSPKEMTLDEISAALNCIITKDTSKDNTYEKITGCQKEMTKKDLKYRMVVELRSKERCITISDIGEFIFISQKNYYSLYSECLHHLTFCHRDIVKIFPPVDSLSKIDTVSDPIWERVEITQEDIEKELGYPVKIVDKI